MNFTSATVSIKARHIFCTIHNELWIICFFQVKQFLDFLIKEGFEVQDIANKPRVLTASQKTVEQRLNKLRKIGLSEINLNVLCRSRKDFKKYCDSIGSVAISSQGI